MDFLLATAMFFQPEAHSATVLTHFDACRREGTLEGSLSSRSFESVANHSHASPPTREGTAVIGGLENARCKPRTRIIIFGSFDTYPIVEVVRLRTASFFGDDVNVATSALCDFAGADRVVHSRVRSVNIL